MRTVRPLLSLVLTFAITVGGAATATAAPSDSDASRATFGVQPVTNGKPDGRPTLLYGTTEGGFLADHVAVINKANTAVQLDVYATDAINDDKGGLTLLPVDKKAVDAGSWFTFADGSTTKSVTIKADSFVVLAIEAHVPGNAFPGDHVAGIVADLVTIGKRGNQPNVRLHQRVGLRAFVRVAGDVHAALAVDRLTASYNDNWNPLGDGSAVVTYRLRNVGNVSLGARQKVSIDNPFGTSASVNLADIQLLLPGASLDVRVRVPDVFPLIWMSATVDVAPIVPTGVVEAAHSISVSTDFWAIPWVLIGLLILLVVGVVWWYRRRRRAGGRPAGRHSHASRSRGTASRAKAGVGA